MLLAAEGREAGEIGEGLRLHAKTARFWLKRFNAHGLAGLEESERPGRPPVYPADQVGAVIGAALTRPADLGLPFASWTLDRLVAYLGEAKGIAMRRSRVGCCWLLMALLFVLGVMNLLWVATLAAFVLLEKVVPRGDLLGRAAGVFMLVGGVLLLAGSAA